MRELTKAITSYAWALSVFGVQQTWNLFSPDRSEQRVKVRESLNRVTSVTASEFDSTLKSAFRAGDNLQRGVVDLFYGGMTLGLLDPNVWMKRRTSAAQQSADTAAQAERFSGISMDAPESTSQSDRQAETGSSGSGTQRPQRPGWGPVCPR